MKSFTEWFFTTLGAAVVIYYGAKLLLFTRMLYPKRWFPLPKSFFSSMGEWAGKLAVCVYCIVCVCRVGVGV